MGVILTFVNKPQPKIVPADLSNPETRAREHRVAMACLAAITAEYGEETSYKDANGGWCSSYDTIGMSEELVNIVACCGELADMTDYE